MAAEQTTEWDDHDGCGCADPECPDCAGDTCTHCGGDGVDECPYPLECLHPHNALGECACRACDGRGHDQSIW